MNDPEAKVFDRCQNDTWFYPGHGKTRIWVSNLGMERPHLEEWRERR